MKPTHEIMENNFHRVASAANSVVSVQSGNRKKVASFLRKKVEEPLLRSGNSTLENLSCTVGTVVASSLSMLPMQLYRVSHIIRHPHILYVRHYKLLCRLLTVSMTSLLTHTVAHSTRPSFRLKTNNQPLKKFLSLAVS